MSSQSTHILARTRDLRAVALVLLSAALFGALGVLAQLAYSAGVSVIGLLLGRFAVAAVMLWLIVLVLRRPLPSRRGGESSRPRRGVQLDGVLLRGVAEAH